MNGVVASLPAASKTNARFASTRASTCAPGCHSCTPGARHTQTPIADIDMHEAFRPAEFGHADLAGKVEARRLPVADGHGVGAKAEPIDAVRQSRQGADDRKIAPALQCDDRAALLDDELIQRRIGKDPRGFDIFRPSIDAGGRPDLRDPAFVQGDGRAAKQQGFRRLGRRVDQDGAGLGEYARQFLAQFLAQLIVEIGQRLVEQNQFGALDEGASDGGALLLAAGELRRQALQKVFEPQQARRFVHARVNFGAADASYAKRRGDVLVDRERGIVDELLIDHRDGTAANRNVRDVRRRLRSAGQSSAGPTRP